MTKQDIRWVQRFSNFRKAFAQLDEARDLATQRRLSRLEKQGLIQSFEYTHELAWNVLKDFLVSRGAQDLYGSKDVTREAFSAGLIENGEVWMEMIQSRNQTMHTYNETTAEAIYAAILTSYVAAFQAFQEHFAQMQQTEATRGGVGSGRP